MKVSVIGLGYIGLPTAALLASCGVEVRGIDTNEQLIATINSGKAHIKENYLEDLLTGSIKNGSLFATNTISTSDVYIIAVPTPLKRNNEPDIKYIKQAIKSLASVLVKGNLIILESTSPVGTTEMIAEELSKERRDLVFPTNNQNYPIDINIAYCPERVIPGNTLEELVNNDRIIGGLTKDCANKAEKLYKIFVAGNVCKTTSRVAELCKLTENTFRDVNIAFSNEISMICDNYGIDVWELIKFANMHPRVNLLRPGSGVGGHCIAVDPWFIISDNPKTSKLITSAREVNNYKPKYILTILEELLSEEALSPKNTKIACFGITYKPDTDDMRESPSIEIIKYLAQKDYKKIYVVDPNIDHLPENLRAQNLFLVDKDSALKDTDVVLMLVSHKEFMNISKNELRDIKYIDTVGILKKNSKEGV